MAKPGRQKSRTWDHFRPVSGTSRMRCTRCSTEVTARRDRMQKHWDGCVVQGPRESEHSLIAKPGDRRDGDPRWNQPGRKRTATWRHFKDSPDHKGKARCDKCGYELSARVDRMKKHLIVCRPELGIEIESAAKDVKPEPSPREPEQQTPQNGLERANGRRLTESDVRALNRTLGRLILRHNIHIDLLDDPELKNLWQGIVYVPPSRQSWMSVIEDLWRMEKSKSETFVRRSRRLTLVTDACREPKTPHFASFIAVNENGESVMWDMSPVSADVTVENVGEGLKMRLNRLRQLDKVIAVTTDGGIMMNSVRRALEKDPAYEGVIFGHCLVQQTRKMAKDLLLAGGDLWTKLKTVERICSQIVASSEAQEFLRTFEGYKEVEMQGVNASEWNSVLYCLIRITQNRPALKTLVRRGLSMGIGFEEKEAIADEDFWLAVEGIMPVARVFCFLQGLSESCELTSGCVAFGFYWIRRIVQTSKNFTDVLRESMTEAIEERIRLALGMEAYVSWYLDPRLRGAGMKDRDVHKTCVAASDMAVRLGIFGDEDVQNWKDNLFLEWHDYKDGKGSFDLSSCWNPAVTRKPERFWKLHQGHSDHVAKLGLLVTDYCCHISDCSRSTSRLTAEQVMRGPGRDLERLIATESVKWSSRKLPNAGKIQRRTLYLMMEYRALHPAASVEGRDSISSAWENRGIRSRPSKQVEEKDGIWENGTGSEDFLKSILTEYGNESGEDVLEGGENTLLDAKTDLICFEEKMDSLMSVAR